MVGRASRLGRERRDLCGRAVCGIDVLKLRKKRGERRRAAIVKIVRLYVVVVVVLKGLVRQKDSPDFVIPEVG
jgi:hypothetical protein